MVFEFWGKAERGKFYYHPAVCHMLDAGIVARQLFLSMPDEFRHRFASEFSDDADYFFNVVGFLTSLHDIGKISPGFQAKREDLCEHLRNEGYRFSRVDETRHGQVALDVLPALLENEEECDAENALVFSRVLAAHHGAFLCGGDIVAGSGKWEEARKAVVSYLANCFRVGTLEPLRMPTTSALLLFAGLVSVADWLASAEENFPYLNGVPESIDRYILEREKLAKEIVHRLKFDCFCFTKKEFSELFEFDSPNPCQSAALKVIEQLEHPMFVVIESPMGTGKTEAAQAGFACISSRESLRGMYYALPTQATGNAMLPRMQVYLEKLGMGGAELHLLHANRDLNPDYDQLRVSGVEENEGGITASGWFTARKRGLLAGYGVGTLDQALLAVIKARHFFVRLFGLSGKLLVLDEVHAYDAYMVEEIYRLIGWLAHCQTSIFLLSATLPKARREKLAQAFSPGILLPDDIEYPCVIGINGDGELKSESIRGLEEDTISMIPVVTTSGEKVAYITALLKEKLEGGGCAACIMNTVSEAQRLYEDIKQHVSDADLILFHSRFTLERKLEIEKALLDRYGKKGTRPQKGIVIATQVIEQSLDVDFDLMVTDIAPVDLLLQRAGRLHRHKRNRAELLKERTLYVLIPDFLTVVPNFGGSGKIYAPEILLRTGLLFAEDGSCKPLQVSVPYGVSKLIEHVYGEGDGQKIPDHLLNIFAQWQEKRIEEDEGSAFGAKHIALMEAHTCTPDYLGLLANDFDDDRIPVTRLTRVNVTLIVLAEGEGLAVRNKEEIRRLYARSVTTDNSKVVAHFIHQPAPVEWQEAPLLRNCRPLFVKDGKDVEGLGLTYDHEYGLRVVRANRR